MASSGCVEVFLYLLAIPVYRRDNAVFSVTMTDEFKPIIRDPHKSANMLEQPVVPVPAPQPSLPQTDSQQSSPQFAPSPAQSAPDQQSPQSWQRLSFPDAAPVSPIAQTAQIDPIEQVLSPREVNAGLAKADPLTRHPRVSSIILSVVFGLLLLAAAAGVWWLGVRTMEGQSYEDMVWSKFDAALPGWLEPVVHVFTISTVVIATSAIMSIIALAVLIVRKRWLLIAQLAVFGGICFAAAELLKPLLPRPYLINLESNPNNSAPSGHAILAATAGVILLCAVPRMCRALVAVIGWAYAVLVGLSVIAGQWHRPTDVIMALLIVGGVAMLMLAATFANGMDEPGSRASSPSVQIVGSVLLTFGVLGTLYGAYIIWQIQPGLAMSAEWTNSGAHLSTVILTASVASLVFGLVLTMRQLTASPLTQLGLVGAPPAPPKR
ncbi:PAP2 family phosphoesterase [Bifidobacterium catenulatum DSM 16992 = JCM 1194 = LMG 11043]|nr:PAP2 family phosphoesterase [Bifidobacterium catenulatum DSM 16992 = JCM 1194 = LMG 11043]